MFEEYRAYLRWLADCVSNEQIAKTAHFRAFAKYMFEHYTVWEDCEEENNE